MPVAMTTSRRNLASSETRSDFYKSYPELALRIEDFIRNECISHRLCSSIVIRSQHDRVQAIIASKRPMAILGERGASLRALQAEINRIFGADVGKIIELFVCRAIYAELPPLADVAIRSEFVRSMPPRLSHDYQPDPKEWPLPSASLMTPDMASILGNDSDSDSDNDNDIAADRQRKQQIKNEKRIARRQQRTVNMNTGNATTPTNWRQAITKMDFCTNELRQWLDELYVSPSSSQRK